MTERQKKLVRYLLIKNYKVSLKRIREDLHVLYPKTSDVLSNCTGRRNITKDIQEINNDLENEILIQSSSKGIWISHDHNEIEKELERERINILKSLKRYYKKRTKLGLNNQIDIDGLTRTLNKMTEEE